jgi:hypothetical protein
MTEGKSEVLLTEVVYQANSHKVRKEDLYSYTADGKQDDDDSGLYVLSDPYQENVVEDDKLPSRLPTTSPGFSRSISSVQTEAEENAKQDHLCLDVIRDVIAAHKDVLLDIQKECFKEIGKHPELSKFQSVVNEKLLLDAISLGYLGGFRNVDFSMSNNLSTALVDQLKMDSKDRENAQIEHLPADVFSDYKETAQVLSELIVFEKHVSEFSKLIKPARIGGVAGGDKFISKSILLKAPRDVY